MIASGVKSLSAVEKPGGKFFRLFYRSAIDWLSEMGEFGIGGIDQDHAPIGEDAGIETREGTAQVLPRAVGIAQHLGSFTVADQPGSLIHQRINVISETDGTDRSPRHVLARTGKRF